MRSSIITILLLSSLLIKAQITITNHSLTDTSQNIFYIGVDNLIKISGKQYKPLEQSLVIKGGGASMGGVGGTYIVKVQKETDDCSIWVYENGKSIFKKKFICRKIGDPVVKYGGLNDSIMTYNKSVKASINQLLENSFLYIDFPGSYYKHKYQILSFATLMLSDKTDSLSVSGDGNMLSSKQKEMIKKLQPGDAIVFEDIYCLDPDKRRRKLTPFIIEIK